MPVVPLGAGCQPDLQLLPISALNSMVHKETRATKPHRPPCTGALHPIRAEAAPEAAQAAPGSRCRRAAQKAAVRTTSSSQLTSAHAGDSALGHTGEQTDTWNPNRAAPSAESEQPVAFLGFWQVP